MDGHMTNVLLANSCKPFKPHGLHLYYITGEAHYHSGGGGNFHSFLSIAIGFVPPGCSRVLCTQPVSYNFPGIFHRKAEGNCRVQNTQYHTRVVQEALMP